MLIFYALLLRLPAWWLPAGELNGRDAGAGILGKAYIQLGINSPVINILLPTLLLFITALFVNRLIIKHRMSEKPSQLPGLFVIMIGSVSPALLGLHSIQPANFFLLLAIRSAYGLYQAQKGNMAAFNAGVWLGIAILFNVYFVVFFLLILIAIFSLSSFSGRLFFQLLSGSLSPLFLAGTWYFWKGNYDVFQTVQLGKFFGFIPGNEAYWNLGGLAFVITALTFAVFRQFANVKMLVIAGRKKVSIIYSWMLLCLLCLLVHHTFDFATAQLLTIPLGILISMSFARGSRSTGEAAHLVMVVCCLGLCIYPILIQ